MKQEWKPGDVGKSKQHGYIGIFVNDCELHGAELQHWHNESGKWDPAWDDRTPLVVLDPEDREQAERLLIASWAGIRKGPASDEEIDRAQAALRSLVAPPRPEEPMGLGALVEADYSGGRGRARWARSEGHSWVCLTPGWVGELCQWSSLVDPRVLAEGWVGES